MTRVPLPCAHPLGCDPDLRCYSGGFACDEHVRILHRCRRTVGALLVEIERGPRAELHLARELLNELTAAIARLEQNPPAGQSPEKEPDR